VIAPVTGTSADPGTLGHGGRVADVAALDPSVTARVERLVRLAPDGLTRAYLPVTVELAQTVRAVTSDGGTSLEAQGTNLRYAAMAALGLSRLGEEDQRAVLAGRTAADLVEAAVARARHTPDPGAIAITAWAAAEVTGTHTGELFDRLRRLLSTRAAMPTVDVAWTVTAAVAAAGLGNTADVMNDAILRLTSRLGPGGTYPHLLDPRQRWSWRRHVGSFADQVYPLQALARASVLTGNLQLLDAANRTADRICRLQGEAGQWWWWYDARTGNVVEAYPVYSVHQHAMAPMVLLDLWEAGGHDHRAEVAAGLGWLDRHPEVREELIVDEAGLVWRKVGRREPRKAARALNAATTGVHPAWHLPGVDRLMPPVLVDHECRPYELGWLLYAWLPARPTADEATTKEDVDG
jgi:hypothetical protein